MKRNLVSSIFVILLTVVFVTCLCPVFSFADSNPSLTVIFNCNFNFFEWTAYSSCTYIKDDDGTNLTSFSVGYDSNNVLRADLSDFNFAKRLQLKYEFRRVNELGATVIRYGVFSISGVTLPHAATGAPTFSLTSFPLTVTVDVSLSSGDGNNYYYCFFDNDYVPPTPTPTPSPSPSPTPSVEDYFMPFRSFSGAYFNKERLYFPDSVTRNHYEQYSGIVSNHDMRILGVETSVGFEDDKVKYLFQYEIQVLETDVYTFDFLYDSDTVLELKSISYFYDGDIYPNSAVIDSGIISGTHTVYGAYDIDPTAVSGPVYYHWDYNLINQKCFSCTGGFNFTAGEEIVIFVIVQSDYMPSGSPTFNWSQFFNDTKPDTVFLTVMGGLSSLPFFVSGLSFLALGALIGIILKFMR